MSFKGILRAFSINTLFKCQLILCTKTALISLITACLIITDVKPGAFSGDFLPPQVIYKGKKVCHANCNFLYLFVNNYRAKKTHVSATRTEPLYYMLIKWGGAILIFYGDKNSDLFKLFSACSTFLRILENELKDSYMCLCPTSLHVLTPTR